MNWKTLSRSDASSIAGEWNSVSGDSFMGIMESWDNELPSTLPDDYRKLREGLWKIHTSSEGAPDKGSRKYSADLDFGLRMYAFLRDGFGMTASTASDDDIWRFIHMKVVPDMIFDRWRSEENETNRINNDRFWKDSRRMWLKTVWWYIHLSLQNGSLDETRKVLEGNGSDDISQLVERSGAGYRVDLYRAIMKRYSNSSRDRLLLRKVLKLNVVRCATVEPLLFSSGIENYVESLFEYFEG